MRLLLQLLVQALHIDLADALGAAHHVRGVHGLVRRYHDELFHTVFHAQVGNDLRAVDVVQDRLAGVVFHHGHMLVCGGVEDVFRPEGLEDIFHPRPAADAGHDRLGGNVREIPFHHHPDVMLRRLRLVDEHHLRRPERSHLADDLRADGTGRSGDEHPLPMQHFPDRFQVDPDLLARQQVFHAHLLQLHVLHFLVAQDTILDAGFLRLLRHVDLATGADQHILDGLVLAELIDPERTHEHRLDSLLLHDGGQVLLQRVHGHAEHLHPLDTFLVRDEAPQVKPGRFLRPDILGHPGPAGQGAIDQYPFRLCIG